jgi:hypothetical protein
MKSKQPVTWTLKLFELRGAVINGRQQGTPRHVE